MTTTTRAALRDLDREYKHWYNRGWRYSAGPSASLDYVDGINAPDAMYDGYLDLATGREKWHTPLCSGCDHPISGPHGNAA